MSEDRMNELGIPRRKFLRSAAATAFVTPVVVSFGLDGVAEGHPGPGQHFHNQTHPNQFCANQTFPNQATIEHDLVQLIGAILSGLAAHELSFGRANSLSRLALNAALAVADDRCHDVCPKLDALVRAIERLRVSSGFKMELLAFAQSAQAAAGCRTRLS